MHSPLRVLIADDHELVRYSLKLAFEKEKHIELVGLARNGQEAVEMVSQHKPDVVVLDLQMPIMDGLSASEQIKRLYPQTNIVAYSSVRDPQLEVMVQTSQIDAFCRKEIPMQELINVVTEVGHKAYER